MSQINTAQRLLQMGKPEQALRMFQMVLKGDPKSVDGYTGIALCHAQTGQWLEALNASLNAMGYGGYQVAQMRVFIEILQASQLSSHLEPVEQALHQAVTSPWLEAQAIGLLAAQVKAKYQALFGQSDPYIGELLQDPSFIQVVGNACISDHTLEPLVLSARRQILEAAVAQSDISAFKHFLAALVAQVMLNDGLYYTQEQEQQWFDQLDETNVENILIKLCYADFDTAVSLWQSHKDLLFNANLPLLCKELTLYAEVAASRDTGDVADETSKTVQSFYIDNPYPKYKSVVLNSQSIEQLFAGYGKTLSSSPKVLIAGCGTGRQAIQVAMANPAVQITAIDLSPASLAYARLSAQRFELTNITFKVLDILDVATLGQTFDYIVSTGVLHHMASPKAGLNRLSGVLNHEGMMLLGFYSEVARKELPLLKDQILQRLGVDESDLTRDDIRRWRAGLTEQDKKQLWLQVSDFFSLSGIMDLLFHPQQAEYELPALEKMLGKAGLKFEQMMNPSFGMALYGQQIGQMLQTNPQPSLNDWHELEQQCPHCFIDMFNFFVSK